MATTDKLISLHRATLQRGERTLWRNLSVDIKAGEFIAVLGPNGAGKTSLLKVLLGLLPLTNGSVTIVGAAPHRGDRSIGYIPQQKSFDPLLPIQGRDLVMLGATGHRFGFQGKNPSKRAEVENAIAAVGATAYATKQVGLLSGGEQQRLRIAQALVGEPRIILGDEPLISLDLASQRTVIEILHEYRTAQHAAVILVTHEINPVLPWVDRILYLANGQWVIDTPERVLTSATLTQLYGTPVDVIRHNNRVIVLSGDATLAGTGTPQEDHQ